MKISDVLFNFQGSDWAFEVESFASHLSVIYLYYINATDLSIDWTKFFFRGVPGVKMQGGGEACSRRKAWNVWNTLVGRWNVWNTLVGAGLVTFG
ncbi:MAG: hypothetical protein RLO19_08365 [Coleofasciculus sp. G2-EDA-02]